MSEMSGRIEQLSPVKRALFAMKDTQAKLDRLEQERTEPIAIVGIGCRFPGNANSPQAFWQLLCSGVDAVKEVPPQRWDIDAYYDPDPETSGKMATRRGGFIEQVDQFDAGFFGISPREAISMDPQQRILLEVAWEALEDAGIPQEQLLKSRTGVFVGVSFTDYAHLLKQNAAYLDAYFVTGNSLNAVAGRLSYQLGLQGPSMAIDTACSSSLVALHTACQSIHNNDCNMALVSGVNAILAPELSIAGSRGRMMSTDGRCKAFDASANGFVRGEGCGVIVLKRYSAAQAQGDRIYALIRGSGVNQDGPSSSLAVPNGLAQQALLEEILTRAGVTSDQVNYIEAHGPGTALGDPIEFEALRAVFSQNRAHNDPLIIGSVKTNIGHLESAAGIAGVIKTALCLYKKSIPPNLHFHAVNPHIDLTTIPALLPTEQLSWQREGRNRFAGVSAFGISGTNAHILLEESSTPHQEIARANDEGKRDVYLLPLSARSADALHLLARAYLEMLTSDQLPTSLHAICYTASARRSHHPYRLAVVGNSQLDVRQQLANFLHQRPSPGWIQGQVMHGKLSRVVFVFPGQGSQWPGMCVQLMQQEPVFLAALQECDQALLPYTGRSVLDVLGTAIEHADFLSDIALIQPMLFAIQIALTALWRSWGVEPAAVIGHSMGEAAAAYIAGALSLNDAACVISTRSRLLKRVSGQGGMAALGLSVADAREVIAPYGERLVIAVHNSPASTVIAGDLEALQEIEALMQPRDISYRKVKISVASHSHQMDSLLADLARELQWIEPQPPHIPLYSTVTAQRIAGETLDSEYWVRNMREPVLFGDTIEQMIREDYTTYIELSPHPLLTQPIECYLQPEQERAPTGVALPSLRRKQDEQRTLLSSLAALYCQGYSLQWQTITGPGTLVALPAYPWQHKSYWPEIAPRAHGGATLPNSRHIERGEHPFIGLRHLSPLKLIQYETVFQRQQPSFLNDHRLPTGTGVQEDTIIVVPGSAYVSLALSVVNQAFQASACTLRDFNFLTALVISDEDERLLHSILTPQTSNTYLVEIYSLSSSSPTNSSQWTLHATANLLVDESSIAHPNTIDLAALLTQCQREISGEDLYTTFRQVGYYLGRQFRWLEHVWRSENQALVRLRQADASDESAHYILHPGIIDGCFQVLGFSLFNGQVRQVMDQNEMYIPVSVDEVRTYTQTDAAPLWAHGLLHEEFDTGPAKKEFIRGDITLCNGDGRIIATFNNVRLKLVRIEVLLRNLHTRGLDWFYEVTWQPAAAVLPTNSVSNAAYVILADRQGVGEALAHELQARGVSCQLVFANQFKQSEQVNWQAWLQESEQVGQVWDKIIYCWELDTPPLTDDAVPAQVQKSMVVLTLVQALAQNENQKHASRLWIITRGVVPVQPGVVALEQASVWGLSRVIGLEHPDLWGGLIDLDPETVAQNIVPLANELQEASLQEELLALRQGQRYVARLSHRVERHSSASAIQSDATYLITGGWGALGLQTARWLVAHGARSLVLLGRSGITAVAQPVIQELEQQGARVRIETLDVSQVTPLRQLLIDISLSAFPLRGIIHAAGVLDDAMLSNQDQRHLQNVFLPKIAGAWNLHNLTQELQLDFFLLFSSASALIGSIGQGNYAAANAFLDSLAHYRHSQGLVATSIAWGTWAQAGMALTSEHFLMRTSQQGLEPIPLEQGMQALDGILGQTYAQIAVLPAQWSELKKHLPAIRASFLSNVLREEDIPTRGLQSYALQYDLAERLAQAQPGKRQTLCSAFMQEQVLRLLALDTNTSLDPASPLMELGIDSFLSLELNSILKQATGLPLPVTLIFDYPTINALAHYLITRMYPEEIAYEAEPQPDARAAYQQADLLSDVGQLSDADLAAVLQTIDEQ